MEAAYKIADLGIVLDTESIEVKERIAHLKAKHDLASKLGMDGQERLHAQEIERLTKPRLSSPELSADEIRIWRAFLPTSYDGIPVKKSSDYFSIISHSSKSLQQYAFDRMPHPVLERLHDCLQKQMFEEYQIWTPEVPAPDPMLVGRIGARFYMVARWAESDANLVTLASIKRTLTWRWVSSHLFAVLAIVVMLSIMFGMFSTPTTGPDHSLVMLFFNSLKFVPVFVCGSILYTLYAARTDELMRAIARHTFAEWKTRRRASDT